MGKSNRIRPEKVFTMVVLDVVLLAIFMAAFLPSHLKMMAATYLPVVLISNALFLNRSRRVAGTPTARNSSETRTGKSSLYICSVVFFVGAIYGLLTIIQGELPRTLLPLLLVPIMIAVFCLKMARRIATQTSSSGNLGANHLP